VRFRGGPAAVTGEHVRKEPLACTRLRGQQAGKARTGDDPEARRRAGDDGHRGVGEDLQRDGHFLFGQGQPQGRVTL